MDLRQKQIATSAWLVLLAAICGRQPVSANSTGDASALSSMSLVNTSVWQPPSAHEYEQLAERRLRASKMIHSEELLDSIYKYLYLYEQMDEQVTLGEFSRMAIMGKSLSSVYSDIYIHRYDNFNELRQSGGAEANQELCLAQLRELVDRAEELERQKYSSRDINIIQLLDTFGKPPAGSLSGGDAFWPGMYHQCLKFTIRLKQSQTANDLQTTSGRRAYKSTPTRYCLTSLRHTNWPKDDVHETNGVIKSGACLPRACDSFNYKNKFALIKQLLETQARPMDRGNFYISDLYCLPDEHSNLRQFWRSPASLFVFLLIASWIGLQIFATVWIRRERAVVGSASERAKLGANQHLGLTSGFKVEANGKEETSTNLHDDQSADSTEQQRSAARQRAYQTKLKLFRCLSITDNFAQLFDTSKTSSLMEAGGASTSAKAQGQAEEASEETPIVDLRSLEGIKVISMSYVILGHVLMCLTMSVNNGREQAGEYSIAFFLANLLPAFAVNSFFTITGLLTAYLLFKRNKSVDFMSSPTNWIAFIAYRYLRIMPMYALVVLYLKTLSKFTGSGPLWDYGTSLMGQRRTCEQESFLWTLLFGANFKPPLDHCIPAAWYLANDFQFFIVTPILLTILNKSPTLGKQVLKWGMFAGYLAGFWSIFSVSKEDLRPVANFMPHGFKTYTSHLSHNYTQPQYRIPAYLFGLLVGFLLHEFEQKQLEYLSSKAKRESLKDKEQSEKSPDEVQPTPADWPEGIKRYGFTICIVCVTICIGNPIIGSRLPLYKLLARFMIALTMPALHVLFAFAVGIYILLASTGFGNPLVNQILSHPLWKPLARLSLCAVLINVEVVSYIVQTSTRSFYIDFAGHFGLDLLCIVSVYSVATVVCVLFEAPVRGALNQLVSHLMAKMAKKRKVD